MIPAGLIAFVGLAAWVVFAMKREAYLADQRQHPQRDGDGNVR